MKGAAENTYNDIVNTNVEDLTIRATDEVNFQTLLDTLAWTFPSLENFDD